MNCSKNNEEDAVWINVKGGEIESGCDWNDPEVKASLTLEVTIKTRYKDIKEFMSVKNASIEHLNKLITK